MDGHLTGLDNSRMIGLKNPQQCAMDRTALEAARRNGPGDQGGTGRSPAGAAKRHSLEG